MGTEFITIKSETGEIGTCPKKALPFWEKRGYTEVIPAVVDSASTQPDADESNALEPSALADGNALVTDQDIPVGDDAPKPDDSSVVVNSTAGADAESKAGDKSASRGRR